jgi:polyisoprenoid-binding protein YceI
MKNLITAFFLLMLVGEANAQTKFFTKTGYAKFYSEAPLEDIEAINNKVQSIIDMEKSEVAINVPITAFQFENSLMQEHFNENYLESEKWPMAAFSGYFVSDGVIDINKNGVYEVRVKGKMTIHGVTKPMDTVGSIEVDNNKVVAKTSFMVKVADYDIEIPTIVFKNIAEEVEVTVELKYLPFKS